jgi:proteasome lid subunit RPN8/RPN11
MRDADSGGDPDREGRIPPLPDPTVLVLDPELHRRIIDHLRAALPNEGVGLLAVEWDREGTMMRALPRRFYPGTNIRQSPVRYQIDWSELVAALRDIDANGWSLGAIVHSHPRGPAVPSATDLAEAWYPDSLMVIVSFAADPPVLRAWVLGGERGDWAPREAGIVVEPVDGGRPGIAPMGELRE